MGGGKHDLGTKYLKTQGVRNLLYDPFNRTEAHNARVLKEAATKGVDSVTALNVLNVIKEAEHRDAVIKQAADSAGDGKPAYFQVYEGNGSGVGRQTTKGWQENRKLSDYVAEIEKHFSQVERHGVYLEARNPVSAEVPAGRPTTAPLTVKPAILKAEMESDTGYVYHATNQERLHEIADSGKLNTHKPHEFTDQDAWPDGSIQKRAYFSKNAGIVWSFAPEDGTPVIVRAKSDPSLSYERSTGDIYSTRPVSAGKLEYLGEDKQWHPVNNLREPPTTAPLQRRTEQDKAYLNAVQSGDTETAQRMAKEAAQKP